MKIDYDQVITHPVDAVWPVLRDNMASLIPLLPSVACIEEVERRREDDQMHLVLDWQASAVSAPKLVRPFFQPEMARWRDYASWNDATKEVHWRFETRSFDDLFSCAGVNYFTKVGAGTRIHITGELEVYPDRVPGVPRILAGRARPMIESFIVGMITPNLADLPGAVQRFLDQQ